jgi:hypothetical protein
MFSGPSQGPVRRRYWSGDHALKENKPWKKFK